MNRQRLAVAVLDIGTTGVRCLVGRIMENGTPKIIAKAEYNIPGGINLQDENGEDALSKSVSAILKTILGKTGIEVKSCYVSISNRHVHMVSSSGEVEVIPRGAISDKTVGNALNNASAVNLQSNECLIDLVPLGFYADGVFLTGKPEGTVCQTFSLDANAVLADTAVTEKITRVMKELDVRVDGFIPVFLSNQKIFDNSAFSYAKAKQCFTVIADVGGEVTDVSVYYNLIPFAFGTIDIGGNDVTRDISMNLDLTENQAQRIKMDLSTVSKEDDDLTAKKIAEENIDSEKVLEIMKSKVAEIANAVYMAASDAMHESGIAKPIINKIFFIGDGMVSFEGVNDILNDSVAMGNCEVLNKGKDLGIKNSFSNALGMLLYISSRMKYGRLPSLILNRNETEPTAAEIKASEESGFFTDLFAKIKAFFKKIGDSIKETIDKLKS